MRKKPKQHNPPNTHTHVLRRAARGGNSHERSCIFGERRIIKIGWRKKGGRDEQKLSICSFKEHVIAFLTKAPPPPSPLLQWLKHGSQRPRRPQNNSQTQFKATCCRARSCLDGEGGQTEDNCPLMSSALQKPGPKKSQVLDLIMNKRRTLLKHIKSWSECDFKTDGLTFTVLSACCLSTFISSTS